MRYKEFRRRLAMYDFKYAAIKDRDIFDMFLHYTFHYVKPQKGPAANNSFVKFLDYYRD